MHALATRFKAIDSRLLRLFRIRCRSSAAAKMALWATRSGDGPMYALAAFGVATTLGPESRPILGIWALGFAIERLLYKGLKARLRRPRPFVVHPEVNALVVPPDRFSFPSGHTSAAFLMAALLSALLPMLTVPIFAWACAVGASRVCLSVHYPSDVLAGALLGMAVARFVLGLS
ncbi:MAG: phosphatase PAP2 family protein [marine benthic group bacterium]|jgi:undecaprenyl-diphosphatase|nr:phosphatase PAP2 family protein [Gemmatimonadota bacterium]